MSVCTRQAVTCILLACSAVLLHAQSADQRAREIVSRMTLDEKISQLHGIRNETNYRVVPGIPRLGIPDFRITNGPAGAGPGGAGPQKPATALPAPIALASTWDRDLAREYGVVAGSESRDLGNGLLEAPTINIARLPQNGRTFEGYGEDPYLVGQLAMGFIQGVQSQGVIANVKHYVANNQETDRFVVNEVIDERTLREIYLPAFEDSIKRGHSASLMCAYPKINGTFCCENSLILDTILKKEWGFAGFVTSDFGAVHSTVESAVAGLDLEMPTGKYWGDDLKAAVESGKVPVSAIDEKLIRRFRTMIEFGVFDRPPTPKPLPAREHGAIALRIAEEGIVLLKNSGGVLPLDASRLKRIALIGRAKASTGGGGSSHVVPLYTVAPAEGLRARVGPQVTIDTSDGADIPAAVALARGADVAIVMVGNEDREGRDQSLSLPGNQDALVQAVAAANSRTVVVLKTGSAVLMPWIDQAPAVLEAWYPGEEDGNAVPAVLFGEVNPAGKLPLSFPRRIEDLPASKPEQYPGIEKVAHYSEGVFVGYRHYDANKIEPLFPFGHGLSYTTFGYRNLRITPKSFSLGPKTNVQVDLDVVNTGRVLGVEVVQLYVGMPSSTAVPQPPKQLKGFKKVRLGPGERTHVQFKLDARSFSYWEVAAHDWKIAEGTYSVMVGSSSRDERLSGRLQIGSGVTKSQSADPARDWSKAVIESTLKRNPDPAKFGGWGYAKSLYLMGQYFVYKRTNDERYLRYIKDWVDSHIDDTGKLDRDINALDYVLPANLALILWQETHEPKYKLAAEKFRLRFDSYPRTTDGGFWHATGASRQWQLWLDGIYMGMPFLVRYGQIFGDAQYANDEAAKQILVYYSHLRDSKKGLLYHAYDESGKQSWADPKTHHSPYFWGRAMGWFGMATVDILDVLPKNHPRRKELIKVVQFMVKGLARYQDPQTGLWYQIVDRGSDPNNWLETSSSSMYAYVIDLAVKRGYVKAPYKKVAEKAYKGVLSKITLDAEGLTNIADISEGTNVADLPYYYGRKRPVNDFHGLGAFVLMNEEFTSSKSAMQQILEPVASGQ